MVKLASENVFSCTIFLYNENAIYILYNLLIILIGPEFVLKCAANSFTPYNVAAPFLLTVGHDTHGYRVNTTDEGKKKKYFFPST